jgi:transposase
MVNTYPPSIELSMVQEDILDLIIKDQRTVQRAAEPEQIIRFWLEGLSEKETADKLGITDRDVRLIRQRWWAARGRIHAAERRLQAAFKNLVSLISRIPNEEITSDATASRATAAGSTSAKSSGTSEINPAARALIEILHHKPKDYNINRSNWSHASLADAFGRVYGRRPSKGTVGRLLRQAGLRWKKSRKVLSSPDPKYRQKVESLLKTLQSLQIGEDLFFIDELGPLQVKRYGGRRYMPAHQTATHPQTQTSKGSITLYGALSALTNQVTWFYNTTKDTTGMIDLVEILFNQNRGKSKISLTWDAASWHGSYTLLDWIETFNDFHTPCGAGPKVELVPLPASAQFLNVIEAVFGGMKRAVIHDSDYASVDEMKTAISTPFVERNDFFTKNPKRAGNKIWEIDFFQDYNAIRSGN